MFTPTGASIITIYIGDFIPCIHQGTLFSSSYVQRGSCNATLDYLTKTMYVLPGLVFQETACIQKPTGLHTEILPYLTYCGLTWHFCRKSDSSKSEIINERGLRAVYSDWSSTYSDLLAKAKMTTLYNRRLQEIATFIFNVKNKLLLRNILELFTTTSNNYNLRNADFTLPKINTTRFGKHSLRYFGPFLWSKLSYATGNCTTLPSFKKNIRKQS